VVWCGCPERRLSKGSNLRTLAPISTGAEFRQKQPSHADRPVCRSRRSPLVDVHQLQLRLCSPSPQSSTILSKPKASESSVAEGDRPRYRLQSGESGAEVLLAPARGTIFLCPQVVSISAARPPALRPFSRLRGLLCLLLSPRQCSTATTTASDEACRLQPRPLRYYQHITVAFLLPTNNTLATRRRTAPRICPRRADSLTATLRIPQPPATASSLPRRMA
jgi:hypothetical protein